MLAIYMPRMRNNNLEIRIAGSSCRPLAPPHKKDAGSDANSLAD